jgi:hypothetical protein
MAESGTSALPFESTAVEGVAAVTPGPAAVAPLAPVVAVVVVEAFTPAVVAVGVVTMPVVAVPVPGAASPVVGVGALAVVPIVAFPVVVAAFKVAVAPPTVVAVGPPAPPIESGRPAGT